MTVTWRTTAGVATAVAAMRRSGRKRYTNWPRDLLACLGPDIGQARAIMAHHPWDWMSITIPLWSFLRIWCHFRHTQTIGRSSTRTIWLGNGLGEISDRKHLSVTEPLLCWQWWDSFFEKPSDQTQAGDQRTLHILEILAVEQMECASDSDFIQWRRIWRTVIWIEDAQSTYQQASVCDHLLFRVCFLLFLPVCNQRMRIWQTAKPRTAVSTLLVFSLRSLSCHV